jgi:hypothetical protein
MEKARKSGKEAAAEEDSRAAGLQTSCDWRITEENEEKSLTGTEPLGLSACCGCPHYA